MSGRAQAVRDGIRQEIWKTTKAMADALVLECGNDKERARLFIRLLEDAHEYALLQLKFRAMDLQ